MSKYALFVAVLVLCGCQSLYYKAQETLGNEKRDILIDRVKKGRQDQQEAKEQYKTTLEAFQAVTGFAGGQTEEIYKRLKAEYDEAAARTKKVSDRIASIEQVSGDMFAEWESEINAMENRELKAKSRGLMREARGRYTPLIRKMKDVEQRAKPVLKAFEDQVLFIKHNLNAEAVTSLRSTVSKMDTEVSKLVADIEASTREADAFLAALPGS
jgi:hypothetical protein